MQERNTRPNVVSAPIVRELQVAIIQFDPHNSEKIDFCNSNIEELTTKQSLNGSWRSEEEVRIALAFLYIELAHAYMFLNDHSSAQTSLRRGEEYANASNDRDIRFHVLFMAGLYHYLQHDREKAIPAFQKSLLYVDTRRHDQIISIFTWLGRLLCEEQAYENALMIYDWIILIDPAPLPAMIEKYECLLQSGHDWLVKSESKRVDGRTCFELGSQTAALNALGKVKQAMKYAQRGLEVARAEDAQSWVEAFDFLIGSHQT